MTINVKKLNALLDVESKIHVIAKLEYQSRNEFDDCGYSLSYAKIILKQQDIDFLKKMKSLIENNNEFYSVNVAERFETELISETNFEPQEDAPEDEIDFIQEFEDFSASFFILEDKETKINFDFSLDKEKEEFSANYISIEISKFEVIMKFSIDHRRGFDEFHSRFDLNNVLEAWDAL